MAVSTFSPTSGSRYLVGNNTTPNGATWADHRAGTDCDSSNALGSIAFHNCDETGGSDGWWLLVRMFAFFDLTDPASGSAIPTGSTIDSGKFVFPIVSTLNSDNSYGFGFTGHTASSTPITADYNNITLNTPTEYTSRIALSALSTSATTDVALDSDGITAVTNAIGSSMPVCMRGNLDIDNSAPNTSVHYNEPTIDLSNFVLSVTYTPPSSGFLALL